VKDLIIPVSQNKQHAGQALLARRMGKKKSCRNRRRSAWCGHGHRGGALRMECKIFMGEEDIRVGAECFRMKILGGSGAREKRYSHAQGRNE